MGNNQIPPERMEAARRLAEDGASQVEITRSTGMARETIIRLFPEAGWRDHRECGRYGRMIRTARKQGLL